MGNLTIYKEKTILKLYSGEFIEIDKQYKDVYKLIVEGNHDWLTLGEKQKTIRKNQIVEFYAYNLMHKWEVMIDNIQDLLLKEKVNQEIKKRKTEGKDINEKIVKHIIDRLS